MDPYAQQTIYHNPQYTYPNIISQSTLQPPGVDGHSRLPSPSNESKTLISELSDPLFINRLKKKLSKIRRHKKWRTCHVKRLQSVRDERQRRRETLHKLIDEWRTEWIAKELASKREQARRNEAIKRVEAADQKKLRHRELTQLLEKVGKLRDIRRERLKREGHFFPEEDNEFFSRVASLSNAMKIEQERLDKEHLQAVQNKREEGIEEGMKKQERERDLCYEYWHQAEMEIDCLVAVRRQWDAYLVPPSAPGASRIPPTFVMPAPPANYIWASCLQHGGENA
ncbi:7559_t:CDS:2 [Paraglomus brasilianum]|uniref:7559_t:CDS:1 n=1 Tax=Paraglomus brasilianum TaxID=144538 RepID=A0A9N9FTR0_9GLOM|nr:7559_t:CDS:2 [Paraglomus brasilianum]